MAYKILGFAVWRGAKWYLRRRFKGAARKAAMVGAAGAVLAGVAVAVERATSGTD
jgi:hypothetical protein